MSRRIRKFAVSAALSLLAVWPCAAQESPARPPNVLLILADDVGFSDLGCYGGEAQTPNLDSLAKNGVRFTQFYNGARCCPSRASLLTGLYAHQAGVGHMNHNDRGFPGYRADLNRQCATIAEVLGDAGYRTYMAGKWHLARSERPDGPKHNWPLQRGFEKFYGIIRGSDSFFDPVLCRGNTWYSRENDPEYRSDDYYFTTALSDNAVTFLRQHEKESPDKPFFLYAAYTAAHWPMQAPEKDIAKYKGRFDAGYEKLREERLKRLRALGLIRPEWEMPSAARSWKDVEHREWELRCMEVYAAMLDSMDQGIGKILAELKRQGQLDNTLILFLQDNGACAEDMGRQPRMGGEKEAAEGTFRPLRPDEIPLGRPPRQTRDGRPVGSGPGVMPGGPDSYIAYGEGWASVSNTPFREYKHWVHEGGIATPLIVHWPKGIAPSRRSGLVNEPAHLIDIMATCVDVAGTSYPARRRGETLTPLEGVSLRPLLEGGEFTRSEPLFWEHEGNRAVRQGRWKLVAKEDRPWELYDMEADRTEMHDLAAQKPELVREMAAKWDGWAERANVLPLGGWKESARPKGSGKPAQVRLKAGAALSGEESPAVDNRALTITVEIVGPKGDGVLVSQGGKLHGYAFSVQEGRLRFDVRRDGELHTVTSPRPLGDDPTTAVAILGRKGKIELLAGGRRMVPRTPVGHLARTPAQGLSAGHDSEDPVGDYSGPFRYEGELGEIRIDVGPAR